MKQTWVSLPDAFAQEKAEGIIACLVIGFVAGIISGAFVCFVALRWLI